MNFYLSYFHFLFISFLFFFSRLESAGNKTVSWAPNSQRDLEFPSTTSLSSPPPPRRRRRYVPTYILYKDPALFFSARNSSNLLYINTRDPRNVLKFYGNSANRPYRSPPSSHSFFHPSGGSSCRKKVFHPVHRTPDVSFFSQVKNSTAKGQFEERFQSSFLLIKSS